MIRHFTVHGYISAAHKRQIDLQGAKALQIRQVKKCPERISPDQQPAYRIEGAFDIDEAEIPGIWQE